MRFQLAQPEPDAVYHIPGTDLTLHGDQILDLPDPPKDLMLRVAAGYVRIVEAGAQPNTLLARTAAAETGRQTPIWNDPTRPAYTRKEEARRDHKRLYGNVQAEPVAGAFTAKADALRDHGPPLDPAVIALSDRLAALTPDEALQLQGLLDQIAPVPPPGDSVTAAPAPPPPADLPARDGESFHPVTEADAPGSSAGAPPAAPPAAPALAPPGRRDPRVGGTEAGGAQRAQRGGA